MKIRIKELKELIRETNVQDVSFSLRLVANPSETKEKKKENYILFTHISMGRRKPQEYILITLRGKIRQFKDLKTGKNYINSISSEIKEFMVNLESYTIKE